MLVTMHTISAICFDLDDTLWDTPSVIQRAEQRLYSWFEDNYPKVAELYSPEQMRHIRIAASRRWPELAHDLTELRLRMLREIASTAGYGRGMVDGAYEVFFAARNEVTLYNDVATALTSLSVSYDLYALSNGNADLSEIGIAHFFSGIHSARDMGVAKPDCRFFVEAARRCGVDTANLMHVGDHPENDIVAAKQTGMHTVWLNRDGKKWPVNDCTPDYEFASLEQLVELMNT